MWKNRCFKFEFSAEAYLLFSKIKLNHRIDVCVYIYIQSREVAPAVAFSLGDIIGIPIIILSTLHRIRNWDLLSTEFGNKSIIRCKIKIMKVQIRKSWGGLPPNNQPIGQFVFSTDVSSCQCNITWSLVNLLNIDPFVA